MYRYTLHYIYIFLFGNKVIFWINYQIEFYTYLEKMANNISGNPYMFEPEYSDNESQDSDSDIICLKKTFVNCCVLWFKRFSLFHCYCPLYTCCNYTICDNQQMHNNNCFWK